MRRTRTLMGILVVAILAAGAGVTTHLAAAGDPGVRTIAMDASPVSVVVDPTTAHAFVLTRTRAFRGANSAGFPTGDAGVRMIEVPSGKVLRTISVGSTPQAVAVDQHAGHAFVVTDDNSVSVLDTRSGAVVRRVAVGTYPRAVAVDPQTHRAYVLNTGDNTISVLDTRAAVVLRTVQIQADAAESSSLSRPATGTLGVTPPSLTRPTYGGGFTGGFAFGNFLRSAAVAGPAHHVFISGGGTVSMLDAQSGAMLHTIAVSGYSTRLAVDTATGQVYFADYSGLSVLDGRTGQVLRTLGAGGPAGAVAVDSRRGRIYVAHNDTPYSRGMHSGPGTVSVVDARTGAVLRTLSVGIAPTAVAVDERTGRVIVVNAGGLMQVHDAWTWVPASLQRYVPFHRQQAREIGWAAGSISIINPVP